MTRQYDGTPIARHLIFVQQDGKYVVQWENEQVQDMFSGDLLPFEDRHYGHAITDSELTQLVDAGRISNFDRSFVWLHALPEGARFDRFTIREETAGRVRHYYLNTTLPPEDLPIVATRLKNMGLDSRYTASVDSDVVTIMNKDGQPFARLTDAENAHNVLQQAAPDLLQDAAVAFVEFNTRSAPAGDDLAEVDVLDLDTLIASQTQRIANGGKVIVAIDHDDEFLESAASTAEAIGAEFVAITSGQEALYTIEDIEPDLVIMDLVMPDTHAWQILARMKANQALASIPVIIISPFGSPSDQVFALTVAKVHDYLTKPVAPSELRKSIWTALNTR